MNLHNESTRALIYRFALAGVALAGAYGLIDPDQQGAWVEIVGTVFGLGAALLATLNTSRKSDDD